MPSWQLATDPAVPQPAPGHALPRNQIASSGSSDYTQWLTWRPRTLPRPRRTMPGRADRPDR